MHTPKKGTQGKRMAMPVVGPQWETGGREGPARSVYVALASTALAHLTDLQLCPVSLQRAPALQTDQITGSATKCVLKPKRLGPQDLQELGGGGGGGLVLTRIAHGGVQEVHGGPGQAQPVHAIWGLFEVRHHANSRMKAPRRIQGARRNAGLPPRSPSSSVGCWGSACGDRRHKERVVRSYFGFLVLSEARSHGAGRGHRLCGLRGTVNSALQGLSPKAKTSSKSKLFWVAVTSFRAWNRPKTRRASLGVRRVKSWTMLGRSEPEPPRV